MKKNCNSFFKKFNIKGNKRKIIIFVGLAWRFVFGQTGVIFAQPYSLNSKSPMVQEKVILNEERDFDASCNSGNTRTIQTKSGYVVKIPNTQIKTSESVKSVLESRGGELGKASSPGSRAKADARRNFNAGKFLSGNSIIPGADGFVIRPPFGRIHENPPLASKPRFGVDDSFQDDGNTPPPNLGLFFSHYKGGPSPFRDKFDYRNSNHTPANTDFSDKKRLTHSYDRHAKKCFNMQENRNNQTLQKFEKTVRDFIESPETQRINGSYRYEIPAYHYRKPGENLIVIVNATNNEYVSVINATKFQLDDLAINGNIGFDGRPSLELRLRGPKQ